MQVSPPATTLGESLEIEVTELYVEPKTNGAGDISAGRSFPTTRGRKARLTFLPVLTEGRYYERRSEYGFDAREGRQRAENPQEVL